jgi:hypothetical protein
MREKLSSKSMGFIGYVLYFCKEGWVSALIKIAFLLRVCLKVWKLNPKGG